MGGRERCRDRLSWIPRNGPALRQLTEQDIARNDPQAALARLEKASDAGALTPETIRSRREGVQQRGREKSRD